MHKKHCAIFLLSALSLVCQASERVLSSDAAARVHGKTLSVISHEPREVAIFGQKFLVAQKDKETTGVLLGDPSGNIFKSTSEFDTTAPDIEVFIPGVEDPAQKILSSIEPLLVSNYGIVVTDRRKIAPSKRGKLMPKTNVDGLVTESADSDLALDVQTYTWQISRISRLTGLWFTYIGRMTLVDRRNKSILAERDCVALQRHPKADSPYLLSYLENDMAAFKHDLSAAASQCTNEFLHTLNLPQGGR